MPILPIKKDCCGCTACSQTCSHNAISMIPDEEGFLYPQVSEKCCVECGLCSRSCPILHYDNIASKDADPIEILGMENLNPKILHQSSSGGVFFQIAKNVIEKGGVVYGVIYDDEMTVRHKRVDKAEELCLFCGSKYVQSRLEDTFKDIKKDLQKDIFVLFSGTACQVDALHLFLRKDYPKLITTDLICHGVPSPLMFSKYIDLLQRKYRSKVVWLNMRDKEKGWTREHHYRIYLQNGKSYFDNRHTNLWTKMYFSENISRPSCHVCRFTNYLRPSDITIADFLWVEERYPEFYQGNGVSLVIVNTEKGKEIIEGIKDQFRHFVSDKEGCSQPCLHHPSPISPRREQYWKDVYSLSFEKLVRKYHEYGLFDYYTRRFRIKVHNIRVKLLDL